METLENENTAETRKGTMKMLYNRSNSLRMLPFMRPQRCIWFLALLAAAGALLLTSCMNQEGIGPGEGELSRHPSQTGGAVSD